MDDRESDDGPVREDNVIVLYDVSWEDYLAIDRIRGDRTRPKLAYLDGMLELMTTGTEHELDKKVFARFLEAYAEARRIRFNGAGGYTLLKKLKKAGIEPDECYFVGPVKEFPDLAIEVVKTSCSIDKLEIYRRFGVCEVWFWIQHVLHIYSLVGDRYQRRTNSTLLRGLDVPDLVRRVDRCDPSDQTEHVRRYRLSLEAKRRRAPRRARRG